MSLRLILAVVGLMLAWAAPASAQDAPRLPTRCECADCFAFAQRRSQVATRLYTQGLDEMRLIRENAPLTYRGEGEGYARDDAAITQAQRNLVGGLREVIGNGLAALDPLAPQCKVGIESDIWGGFIHVSMADCSIPYRERVSVQLAVPCPEMYLATLVHELSHVADCNALPTRRNFTPEELMASEIKAGQAGEDVLAVLRHERLEECRRQSLPLTTPLHTDWNNALRFLAEARQYSREFD